MNSSSKLTVKDIATIGMMAAMLEAVKITFQSVPNVEFVTLFIILFTLYLGPKTLIAVWAFVGLECTVWGFGLWTVMYVYIWPILVFLTLLLRRFKSPWPFIILAAGFGLSFGAFCSIPYFFIGGVHTAYTWWLAGLPYDVLHGASNGIIAAILFAPLRALLNRIKKS
ncbi:MAG: hypothetical protein K6F37_07035 [Lachnospiraceae bacterium]|nr:hypothetical protein [Lachnospiraceae bacterium]